jgi:hypothetical protein
MIVFPISFFTEQSSSFTTAIFTEIGTTTWTVPSGVTSLEYLVVAGGGGGGNGHDTGAGGGGGGGMVLTGTIGVTGGDVYTISVGSGGTGAQSIRSSVDGNDGSNSVFGSITALGGSGGRGSRSAPLGVGVGGTAQVSNTTSARGGQGGGNFSNAVGGCGGGGGGASGNGSNGTGSPNNPISGGVGGSGANSSISGISTTYGQGGNGARGNTSVTGSAGATNTGNGGGAGSAPSASSGGGGNGGSGIVIIKNIVPVTANLTLSLSPSSYSGSGSTWDTTAGTTDATLVGSPSYNSSSGFTFNGTSQYGRIPSVDGVTNFTNASEYTVELWFNPSSGQPNSGEAEMLEKWNQSNQSRYPYTFRYAENTGTVSVAVYDGTNFPSVSFSGFPTSTWAQAVGVFNFTTDVLTVYRNGVASGTTSLAGVGNISNTSSVGLACRLKTDATGEIFFKGSIAAVRMYNTALSSAQVLQNFNADRYKYGL